MTPDGPSHLDWQSLLSSWESVPRIETDLEKN